MRSSGVLYGLAALVKAGSAAYTLSDSYPTGLDFFNKFTFYTVLESPQFHKRKNVP